MLSLTLHATPNDSLIMAQSFINLSLTTSYFKKIPATRLQKIIVYVEKELSSIKAPAFIRTNQQVLNTCYTHLYLIQVKQTLRANNSNRKVLLTCSRLIDSVDLYHSHLRPVAYNVPDPFYEFISFNNEKLQDLQSAIDTTKYQLGREFNRNIYPDFQRILYHFDKTGQVLLDSLAYFAGIFRINFDRAVIKQVHTTTLNTYRIEMPLELISQYLQFQYLLLHQQPSIDTIKLYEDLEAFHDILSLHTYPELIPKDNFIHRTFTEQRYQELFERIKRKYPRPDITRDSDGDGVSDQMDGNTYTKGKYYFPETAPFPSCKAAKSHFLPNKSLIKDIDAYMKNLLQASGYEGRYRYYYMQEGFAIGTVLEKIDKNGNPDPDKRWYTTAASTHFNLYDIFNTIFFAQSSHFRMMAFTFCPKEALVQGSPAVFDSMTALLQDGYTTLPQDLETVALPDKTVTILVYHFYQSDVGEVPVLDVTNRLSVADHLKSSPLNEILK